MPILRPSPRTTHTLGAILLAALLLLPGRVLAEETIRWGRFDFSPFEISEGVYTKSGVIDLIKERLQGELVGYSHEDAGIMNFARLMLNFRTKNICHGALIRTPEIEAASYMSIGLGIMPSHVILTSAKNFEGKFQRRRQVSLETLIEDGRFSLTLPSRTMGPLIDGIIGRYKDRDNVTIREEFKNDGLLRMLFAKRFDYTIGYPAEAVFWNRFHPENQLVPIAIEETSSQYTIGRVCCSKNEWGREVVETVNAVLLDLRLDETYKQRAFLPWIPDEMKAAYLRAYDRIVPEDKWSNIPSTGK